MALTISIEGKGVIANCDAETNDTGGTGTGDWSEQGGGTMSLTTDVYLYGSSSIAGKYASKSGFQQFDLGSGNELDFDTSGAEEGQFIYMWINLSTFGVLETLANKGLAIRISSSSPGTSNYKDYVVAGSDGSNGWTGGWKLFVIDPTKTASATNGTCDIGAIRTLGVWIDTASSVRAESLFIDQIAVGKGLRITGTSTSGWKDVVEYCTDYSNRAWGMFQERDGIYYSFGKTYIGDAASQSANVSFADNARVIQYGTSQYYESSAWKTTFPVDACGVIVEDHASYTTVFTDGILVGSDNGRAGSVFIGNADQNVSFDMYGGNHANSVTALYGTTLKDFTGPIVSGNDSEHKFYGTTFGGCSQFDPVGAPALRNCIFSETADADSALLWNENIDVQDCVFIANITGAAIEMPSSTGSPYTYASLSFSGNAKDVLNSSGSAITVNLTGSNATSSEGSAVTFVSDPVTTEITVRDINTGSPLLGARVLLVASDATGALPYQESVTITRSASTATVAHTGHGMATGDFAHIAGADQDEYNGAFEVTVTGANAYTYTVPGTPATTATGTITSTGGIFNTTTNASGIVTDSRSITLDQPVHGRVRSATGADKYKSSPLVGTIDKDSGLNITSQMIPD